MASSDDPTLAQFSAVAPRPHHHDPEHIGPYRILEKIGEGGMGIIYKAEQREPVRRLVALKVIKLGMDTKEVLARFEAERQALALMNHPNIARVVDAGITDHGRPFFAMEHVPGVPLNQYCEQNKLPIRQRLEIFILVCHAIQHAHQKGIIHRDIKPSNILVTMFDGVPVPKVIDFGIAKATNHHLAQHTLFTQTGALIGTPEYMSPEQAMTTGMDVDTRTDIYSLGVILYELLTGTLPFDPQRLREAGLEGMARIIRESEPHKPSSRLLSLPATNLDIKPGDGASARPPTGPSLRSRLLQRELRGDLDWIVLKAIEKDRTRRYETASALAMDIRRHLDNEPVLACPPSTTYRLSRLYARHRASVLAGAAFLLVLILGIVGTTIGLIRARDQRDIALRATTAEVEARKAAEKARDDTNAANLFLQDLGASVGYGASVRERIDAAARRLDEGRLSDQPEVRASCRITVGYYYFNMDEHERARRHFVAALDIYRLPDGSYPLRAATALTGLARVHTSAQQYAEAERLHRQALHLYSQAPYGKVPLAYTLELIAQLRANQRDHEGARQLRLRALVANIDAQTHELAETPKAVGPHLMRAGYKLRLGRFADAVEDYRRVIGLDPDDHQAWFSLGCIHAYLQDEPARAAVCDHLERRYADDPHGFLRERIAVPALLRPVPLDQLARIHGVLDRAIAPDSPRDDLLLYNLCKALAEYRSGHFDAALDVANKARGLRSHADQATLDLIHALCSFHLGHTDEARRFLREAASRIATHLGNPGNDDLGSAPHDYLIAHVLLREAQAVIKSE